MRIVFAVVCCLLAALTVQAQTYRFKVYTSSTGLPSNAIYSIFQDSKGYLWFGTDGGVCRYDGLNYLVYNAQHGLIDPRVNYIFEDKSNNLWILTRSGVSRFDGKNFTNYTVAQGLPQNETHSGLVTRDGKIWLGSGSALLHFDGTKFIKYGTEHGLPAGPIWSMVEAADGALWLGIRGGGIARFDGQRFTSYGKKDGMPDEAVFGVTLDREGGLWIASDGGLCYFDGKSFRSYTSADGLGNDLVSTVLVDKQNRVWCGTFGGGIGRLEQGRFTVFNRGNGLPDNYVMSLYEDYEGNIWSGTRWNGACRLSSEKFANYTKDHGIGEGLITGIAEAKDGTLWFSSINTGMAMLEPGSFPRRYGLKDGLLEEGLWTVYIDSRGRVWTCGQKGISYYEGGRIKSFTTAQMGTRARITTISEDRQGRIWFGSNSSTADGAVVYDDQRFKIYSEKDGLPNNLIYSFARDRKGDILICTANGLSRYHGQGFVNYNLSEGLPDKQVICAHEDEQGRLWVGTGNGLARFDGSRFITYSNKDGLVGNVVRAITSRNGIVWIGTLYGISAFDGAQFTSYTVKDGLISNEVAVGAALARNDGTIWFGTNEGAIRYQSLKDMTRALPPRLYITGIRSRDALIEVNSGIELNHNQNTITFEFLGISFTDEASVRYSYWLDGFDREWSPPTEARNVRFTNLTPGRYQFLVKARSGAGLWSAPQSIVIDILPPYWQTWWFRLLVVAITISLGYLAYTWRIRRIERRQEQRIASLRQLLESIRTINSQLDLKTVLQNIAAQSAQLIDGEPGGIGLVVDDCVIFSRLWFKDHWEDTQLSFKLGEGIAGRVAVIGAGIIVNDPKNNPQVVFPELIEKYYVHGFLDVPIFDRHGKVVGVLDVRSREGRLPLNETDRQLIEALAHQAAIAIENADLYGTLEKKNQIISESLREIEQLYKKEQEISRALQQLNQMKTNFLIVTSHEMRTPLTVLKGYCEALLEGYLGNLSTTQRRSLTTCQRTVDRLVTTVNDMLEMLKISEGQVSLRYTNFEVGLLLEETVAELKTFIERRDLTVRINAPADLPLVEADAGKMRLVLLNLILNAIKFTPDGGEIKLRAISEPNLVHITIADTGIGIPPGELELIFEKFYTGTDSSHHTSGKFEFEARGTGLGLAIVKSYVEAHGGRVWAESAGPGKGSCFHVIVPLAPAIRPAASVQFSVIG